jgi:exonuclease V
MARMQHLIFSQDEIDRKPLEPLEPPKTPRKSKKANSKDKIAADASPSKQTALTTFFPVSPAKPSNDSPSSFTLPMSTVPPSCFTLHLSDTKTRRASGLPSDEDTISGRLQLMLYSRFLSTLLSSPSDLEVLFVLAEVDPTRPLSEVFCGQIGPLLGLGVSASTLNAIVALWTARVADLGVSSVHPTLTLVYRAQEDRGKGRGKRKRVETSVGDEALQRAIKASLEDATKDVDRTADEQTEEQIAAVISSGLDQAVGSATMATKSTSTTPSAVDSVGNDADLIWTVNPEKVVQEVATTGESAEPTSETSSPSTSNIIGTKSFSMDDAFLNEQIARSLAYWYGARTPEGVPVDLSRRCLYVPSLLLISYIG